MTYKIAFFVAGELERGYRAKELCDVACVERKLDCASLVVEHVGADGTGYASNSTVQRMRAEIAAAYRVVALDGHLVLEAKLIRRQDDGIFRLIIPPTYEPGFKDPPIALELPVEELASHFNSGWRGKYGDAVLNRVLSLGIERVLDDLERSLSEKRIVPYSPDEVSFGSRP